jgi:hypothetical protein
MMRLQFLIRMLSVVLAAGVLVAMTGCAHSVSMAPNVAQVSSVSNKIDKSVAYVISQADMMKEVQTPGGGGDKIKYQPYKDLDASLYQAFSAVFSDVNKVSAVSEAGGVSYVILPSITTNSSSDSLLTWPPTRFSVYLVCKVLDTDGRTLTEVSGTGEGAATFSEFKSDFSLAARRASRSAVDNLVKALLESPELRR